MSIGSGSDDPEPASGYAGPLSVVVPVYNSAPSIAALVARVSGLLIAYAGSELILVNDGSRDSSWAAICEAVSRDRWVRGINLMRNYGQHNALLCGIRAAHNPVVVTIDDDLQNPPEEIPRLLGRLDAACDVVYGTPIKQQHGLWRDCASYITKWALSGIMGAAVARNVSAFRAFRTNMRDAFEQFRGPFVSIDVLLTWGTSRFAAVEVQHDARAQGASQYTFRRLLVHALNMVTGFSTLPLQLGSLAGFAFTIFGGLVLLFVLGRYLVHGGSVPGFPFLASLIAIFSGVQLFALGLIGEYLARVHFRTMDRPTYTVRARAGLSASAVAVGERRL